MAEQADFGKAGDRDLVLGPATVYRQWRFNGDKLGLVGSNGALWPEDGRLTAECVTLALRTATAWPPAKPDSYVITASGNPGLDPMLHGSEVPDPRCGCGVYGWYLPMQAWDRDATWLHGVAEVSGKCVLGSRGLRAAKARMRGVVVPDERLRRVLHVLYPGVDLFAADAELLEAYPPQDWSELVGEVPEPEKEPEDPLAAALAQALQIAGPQPYVAGMGWRMTSPRWHSVGGPPAVPSVWYTAGTNSLAKPWWKLWGGGV